MSTTASKPLKEGTKNTQIVNFTVQFKNSFLTMVNFTLPEQYVFHEKN